AHHPRPAAGVHVYHPHAEIGCGCNRMRGSVRDIVEFKVEKHVESAPLLIAVTVLTSMDADDLRGLGIELSPAEQAERLARLTHQCGLDGVVCSAQEASHFKQVIGQQFCLVTPGIRPADSDAGDQRRIMMPQQALQAGGDYMVIGRPITQSSDPAATLRNILSEL
ncbi:orotidine-5'-phosphate decarboxylase, partial [Candidatus Erwinia dacicola]|nr:orotidine-5'-phosphate decarboxylase [Candidatus Erwinia dacicola]